MQSEQMAFSRREAADTLRVSLRTLDSLLSQKKLRGSRIGRRIVIPRAEIERILRQGAEIRQVENDGH